MKIPLSRIAHARSSSAGAKINIGVIAWKDAYFELLIREVTAGRVKTFLNQLVEGPVLRYELPNLAALNLVCYDSPGCEPAAFPHTDPVVEKFGALLLEMEIEVDEHELKD